VKGEYDEWKQKREELKSELEAKKCEKEAFMLARDDPQPAERSTR
jgi:hypothetical protein